jgi:tetratricopeptide (TPR) repeat protein
MRTPPGQTLRETVMFPAGGPAPDPPEPPGRVGVAIVNERPIAHVTRPSWIQHALDGAETNTVAHVAFRPGDAVPGTRYVVERWLGDGGMGVVYEARHVDIDRRVALKVLRAEMCRKPNVIRQFRDEARVVSRIGSQHICDVTDFAELPDGRLLFAMELLSGNTVGSELQRGPMDAPRVLGILRQACKALAAAHAAKIIHRDLKPDNIALDTRNGRADYVKVLDFGVAIVMAEAGVATHLAAGTPCYLAPEVILGGGIDLRVDIYAVGCTAYEMLVGEPPFHASTVEATLRAHMDEAAKSPRECRPEIPQAVSDVVMRCIAKDPAARYPDMIELEAALCEAQIAARIQTSWDDLPIPDIDPERRVQLLSRMPDHWAGESRSRRRTWLWSAVAAVLLVAAIALVYALRAEPVGARERLDAIVVAAHEAAAKSYFVYPPPSAPDSPTAFGLVRELESKGAELGRDAPIEAGKLRREFAATLVRLGDEYWEREGGKPFAIDYYAEALVFDPEHEHAAARASLTLGQLASLREKAQSGSFTEAELIAAEPLIALAEPDLAQRSEKVAALIATERPRAASTSASLERLEGGSRGPAPRAPVRAIEPAPPAAPVIEATPTEAPAIETPSATPPVTIAERPAIERDPAKADELVQQGKRARAEGRQADALRLFEQALAHDARSHAAVIGLSDLKFDRGEYSRAVTHAKRAVKLAPGNAEYRIRLGDAEYKMFRYEEARAAYEAALELGHPSAAARIAKVDAKLK